MRLDQYLVNQGLFESRNKAQDAIKSGLVLVDGKELTKVSFKVSKQKVEVKSHKFYVSRAARKLEEYLKEFDLPIEGKRALDIGSSTGGFTQILLENGAKSVDCVDVGKEQLHSSLREDTRVRVYEECDIREFKSECYNLIVSDVSFISLIKIIPSIDRLSCDGCYITLLFKPQFEVGKDAKRDSNGVVLDSKAIELAKDNFLQECIKFGFRLLDSRESKVKGKEGNQEFIYTFIKDSK